MRSLTVAEARVIEAHLAVVPGDEADRARQSGLPRTTFQTIRKRLLVAGWIYDRYVPAPSAVGASKVTFWLAQPFAERRADVVRLCRTEPDVVVLWASPDTIFAVSFDRTARRRAQTSHSSPGSLVPGEWLRRSWTFETSPGPNDLPVYFDYEGEWSSRVGMSGPISYPQGLSLGPVGVASPPMRGTRELLSRPFEMNRSAGLALSFSPAQLPRRLRHLLAQGWATHRVLPALAELPAYRGERDERVVFVTGVQREGSSFESLRSRLFQECRVAPFLAVHDHGRILLAMLSPAPAGVPARSRSVLGLFQEAMREIEVLREPLDTLFPLLDHRYDRLAPEEGEIVGARVE
jgi:hypothetical protein